MGLLNSLLKGLIDTVVDGSTASMQEKYEAMPLNELKREWRDAFDSRSGAGMYDDFSPLAVLDEVYARRVHKKTWVQQECERMPKKKLESLWKSRFENRSIYNMYKEGSASAVIDEVYAKRTHKKTWKKLRIETIKKSNIK